MRLKMAKEPINSVDTYQGDDIMALAHARSGELITLTPLTAHRSETLIRDDHMEVAQMVLTAGQYLKEHAAAGAMIIQVLKGAVDFDAHGKTQRMTPGHLMFLRDSEPHAVSAIEDTVLLLSIFLHRK
jgi:quercetin dioxygenase-like cupin family protein